jgi:hypothetical protein
MGIEAGTRCMVLVHREARKLAFGLAFLASGCATAPSIEPIQGNAKFAYAIGKFDPPISINTSGSGSYAGVGALSGVGACGQVLASPGDGFGAFFSAMLFLVCAPFGAVIGAATGAARAPLPEQISSAEARIAQASKGLNLQAMLADGAEAYAHAIGASSLNELREQGPKSAEDNTGYSPGPDYVIEMAISTVKAESPGSSNFPYAIEVSANGRLVRTSDNSTVDSFSKTIRTRPRTVQQWTAAGGAAISDALRQAVAQIAQAFMDEWFLVYREDHRDVRQRDAHQGGEIPTYVLRPVDWPLRTVFPTTLQTVGVESRTPTLRWQPLPADLPETWFRERARNLVYDVRIFRMDVIGAPGIAGSRIPGDLVQRYYGLTDNSVRVGPLSPCGQYYWTVRARFELDGRQRSTEWSGAYNMLDARDPRSYRRGATFGWPMGAFMYPFISPPSREAGCPGATPAVRRYPGSGVGS